MQEMIFGSSTIENGLAQAYKIIKKEGYHQYILLGVKSGGVYIANELSQHGRFGESLFCKISEDRATISAPSKIKNKNILICEDTLNTGRTVKKVITELKRLGAGDIKIFSLLMRKNSAIVPNIFVFEVAEDTKVYFPWTNYPIRDYPKGIVRKIFPDDCNRTFECVEPRINKYTLSDYYKNQQEYKAKVYVVEDKEEICAIIQFVEKEVNKYKGLYLDVIATATGKEGQRYASTLLNLITRYMHYHEFDFINGYAFDNAKLIKMYKTRGYDVIDNIENMHYSKLHKIVMVNEVKNDKEVVLAAIRKSI